MREESAKHGIERQGSTSHVSSSSVFVVSSLSRLALRLSCSFSTAARSLEGYDDDATAQHDARTAARVKTARCPRRSALRFGTQKWGGGGPFHRRPLHKTERPQAPRGVNPRVEMVSHAQMN